MINLQQLSKIYRHDNVETAALTGISLDIKQGEFVAIMGPSGCGKSTLLNLMGLLDKPSSGDYRFMGQSVIGLAEKEMSILRKNNIGFIFQNFNLIDELTVRENIELALLYQNKKSKLRNQLVNEVMDKVGVGHRANHLPGQLSGGQQQRVAVARAIVGEQKLILADEPTGNLDSANGQDVMEILQAINDEGTTIVMVTHSAAHADYAQRTINLFDGQLVSQDIRKSFRIVN